MSERNLSPTVLWAQRKHFVLLRVQVKPLEVSVGIGWEGLKHLEQAGSSTQSGRG